MDDFKKIVIKPGKPVNVSLNPTQYPLVGRGLQGAVFKLDDDRCVKIYSRIRYCRRESKVYRKINESAIIPKVWEIGSNYMIMEHLKGPSLEEYLKTKGYITESISARIIEILKEMERFQFPRIDFALRHCLFTEDGALKIIDHVNSFKVKRTVPTRLMKDLRRLGLLEMFLEHVRSIEPDFFQKWLYFQS